MAIDSTLPTVVVKEVTRCVRVDWYKIGTGDFMVSWKA